MSAEWTKAAYDDGAALDAFAAAIDVATVEFENVPAAALERIARTRPVRPSAAVLAVTQDRLAEKVLANRLGIGTAPFHAVASPEEAAEAARHIHGRGVVKTRRMGYDGKGQAGVAQITAESLTAAWDALGRGACILEGFVDFTMEASVLVARSPDGHVTSYAPIENRHADHILAESLWPAALPAEVGEKAEAIARALAAELDYVGLMAVELFITAEGRVLMNEIAPRVHNSGHLTIEAAATSQFEQHIRAVCGLPLGSVARLSDAVMVNLLGDAAKDWLKLLADPGRICISTARARRGRAARWAMSPACTRKAASRDPFPAPPVRDPGRCRLSELRLYGAASEGGARGGRARHGAEGAALDHHPGRLLHRQRDGAEPVRGSDQREGR